MRVSLMVLIASANWKSRAREASPRRKPLSSLGWSAGGCFRKTNPTNTVKGPFTLQRELGVVPSKFSKYSTEFPDTSHGAGGDNTRGEEGEESGLGRPAG